MLGVLTRFPRFSLRTLTSVRTPVKYHAGRAQEEEQGAYLVKHRVEGERAGFHLFFSFLFSSFSHFYFFSFEFLFWEFSSQPEQAPTVPDENASSQCRKNGPQLPVARRRTKQPLGKHQQVPARTQQDEKRRAVWLGGVAVFDLHCAPSLV